MPLPGRRFPAAVIQTHASENVSDNLERSVALVREAARRGAQVICLQELFRSRYFCIQEDAARFDLAEPLPGPSTAAMSAVAREHGVVIVVPVFEQRAVGLYHNSAAVIDADGSIAGVYRKMHIPDDPRFYEKFYFTPGDLGFKVIDTKYARVGVLICWDQWYPEGARLTALQGADILFYPTAIGCHPPEKAEHGEDQLSAWVTMQRSHAIANGIWVAAANRTGLERDGGEEIEFWGSSFICNPAGRVVASASRDREEILIAECSTHAMEETRRGWPFLRDRRIDAYGPILNRWNA